MNRAAPHSARATALSVLRHYSTGRGDAGETLRGLLTSTDRTGQATDLVYGVLRNTVLLDRLISRCGGVEKSRIKPTLRDILRIGVYEWVFATKTAEYAIVNEAVNLAQKTGSRKGGGFVNAVLRNIQRSTATRDAAAPDAAPTHIVPRADGSACVFCEPILPDPTDNLTEYLHLAWSLPPWLVRDWIAHYGHAAAEALCRASNRQPSVYAWPDVRRITAEQLAERLTQEGVVCRLWDKRGAVAIRHSGAMTDLAAFREGLFYIQDPAAEGIAAFLDPKPGQMLVDVCAAPGGKSVALALRMRDVGRILASDADPVRLQRVQDNIARLHLSSVRSVPLDALAGKVEKSDRLDAVIVDVPCSNTGVLARRVEARRRLERRSDKSLFQRQQALLKTAKKMLKPGAKLLYSTCSVQPEENEHQIQQFLRNNPDVFLIKQQTTLASTGNDDLFDHDGGFMALLGVGKA